MQITLQCCTCGAKRDVAVDHPPAFGFELYQIAREAGWHPSMDTNHGRTLCFCSVECMKKQLTKAGTFRKRLIACPMDTGK